MIRSGDGYLLSSGQHIYASGGIIGLSPNGDTIYEGYDGMITEMGEYLSPSERAEIADFMVALWTDYKAAISKPGS